MGRVDAKFQSVCLRGTIFSKSLSNNAINLSRWIMNLKSSSFQIVIIGSFNKNVF